MKTLTKERTHVDLHVNFAILFWLSLLMLLISSRRVNGGDEGEFSYDPCSEIGPENWGELKEEWEKCKNGNFQSPISLSKWTSFFNLSLGDLTRNHNPADAILTNGHSLTVSWIENAGSMKINNIDYYLDNYHWHHPSEHTLNGKIFPLELHMVHTNNDPNVTQNIAVIGVLFQYGPCDPFLSLIERKIKDLNNEGNDEIFIGRVDPRVARLDGRKYFRYIGSLTTPPCTEDVIWTVMKKVQTVAPYQVELLKQAVLEEKNARPLQNINDRDVFYFDPSSLGNAAD